ncbi:hypothetical protein LR48_Vigan07g268200 [Vigna angularis]|uniref:Uncharacterized protein n=1 Tax=Phaseolus angularis TaxID=3914 RepID=A0A0L9V1T5_PHAAN|nr:hypothetical protein LR48_Vigan07g268200 [Vigna angularis]
MREKKALAIGEADLAGVGKAGGGGLTRVATQRGVGVGVRRIAQWALEWVGVEGVCGLFAIVGGVTGRALDVVYKPTRRAGR